MSNLGWRSALRLSVLCLVVAAPAAADQSAAAGPTVTPSRSYLNLQPRRRAPRRPLVVAPVTPRRMPAASRGTAPRVVCGMTMIPGDNAVDRRMVLALPDGATGGAARPFALPLCAEDGDEARRR